MSWLQSRVPSSVCCLVRPLAAGCEDHDSGTAREEFLGKPVGSAQQVLAVVQHEQELAAGEVARETDLGALVGCQVEPQRRRGGLTDQGTVGDSGELDRPE